MGELCSIEGCDKPVRLRGWCSRHYQRWQRHKDPLGGRSTMEGDLLAFLRAHQSYQGDDCLIWPFGKDFHGYGKLNVDGKRQPASRVMCEMAHGPAPSPEHHAAHDRGGKPCVSTACVNPHHLRWATRAENMADKIAHGTHHLGTRCNSNKLKESEVLKIMALRGKLPHRDIAAAFGINVSTVSMIHNGKLWGWLTGAGEERRHG